MTDLEKELLATCKSLLSAMRDIVSQLPAGEDLADYRLDQCEAAEQQALELINKLTIDFNMFTDEQLNCITYATVGYPYLVEGWTREETIQALNEVLQDEGIGGDGIQWPCCKVIGRNVSQSYSIEQIEGDKVHVKLIDAGRPTATEILTMDQIKMYR